MRRSSKPLPKDFMQMGAEIVRQATEEPKRPESVKEYLTRIGRKGGLKGGKARAKKLSASKRSAIARKAAKAMWAKRGRINKAGESQAFRPA
jgi:hypothetical protein